MKLRLVSFRKQKQDTVRPGIMVDERIVDMHGLTEDSQTDKCEAPCHDVVTILGTEALLDWAEGIARDFDGLPEVMKLQRSDVELMAPVPCPGKVFCLATNYQSHLNEDVSKRLDGEGKKPELDSPRVFMKPSTNTICGDGTPIVIQDNNVFVDYEGELAVIIGKQCKDVSADEAMEYVGGLTCFNDVSERELPIEREEDKDWDQFFDWLNGKWFDNYAPMGPCVVPTRCISDPHNLQLQTRVNGTLKQETSTGLMTFNIPETVAFLSELLTLHPGDVIATGTPSGVGKSDGTNLTPGDTVEVEISEIGVLTSPVTD